MFSMKMYPVDRVEHCFFYNIARLKSAVCTIHFVLWILVDTDQTCNETKVATGARRVKILHYFSLLLFQDIFHNQDPYPHGEQDKIGRNMGLVWIRTWSGRDIGQETTPRELSIVAFGKNHLVSCAVHRDWNSFPWTTEVHSGLTYNQCDWLLWYIGELNLTNSIQVRNHGSERFTLAFKPRANVTWCSN